MQRSVRYHHTIHHQVRAEVILRGEDERRVVELRHWSKDMMGWLAEWVIEEMVEERVFYLSCKVVILNWVL